MYSDNKMVLQLMSLLKQFNISRIVISPGSRHFAFVHSLEADPYFKLYSVVDERSAAFFALGLIQQTGEVVAVTCSSGTACMNYGSAVIEAFYQRLPLLVLSSDRIPEYLNQLEDQMYDQQDSFANFTKYHGQLPEIKNDLDLWYCNRILNEAFLELNHHGRGPVHVNIPFVAHHTDTFSTPELPLVRKISLHDAETKAEEWKQIGKMLKDKKIMIVWGQSVIHTPALDEAISMFCEKTDAIILTDKISNLHNQYAILNTTAVFSLLTKEERKNLHPDVVISVGGNYIFNGEVKGFVGTNAKNWQIGKEDKVIDPFHCLTDIFEMSEEYFFSQFNEYTDINNCGEYKDAWINISRQIVCPDPDYNELFAIGTLLNNLPKNVDLQLANSLTIRMAHLFDIDPSIRVNCNRGVNGIDGSMSTAVGFAVDNDRPTFYITGDLSFFYDMNSLWIRHLSPKMRIMLINNQGGGVMYAPLNDKMRQTLPAHVAAAHHCSAKGWVESVGFKYVSAHTKDEVEEGVRLLLDDSINQPVLLEVFSVINPNDIKAMWNYYVSQDRRTGTEKLVRDVKRTIKKLIGR